MKRLLRFLVLALAACTQRGPGPALSTLEPATAVRDEPVDLVLRGERFHPRTRLDFDHPALSTVDSTFTVQLGDALAEEVLWLDEQTLRAHFSALAPAGTFDVVVTDPVGATATLAAAFTVTEPAAHLSLESRPDGSGAPVPPLTLRPGAQVALFAVGRDAQGASLGPVSADWALTTPVATVSPAVGNAVVLTASTAGEAEVLATAPHFAAARLKVTVAPCASDADCRDACHGSATCDPVAGLCSSGASTRDGDGDGFVDGACPGGDDCDDGDPAIHPGVMEAPPGSAVCTDGKDNDCDGRVDSAQASCRPNSAPLPSFTLTPAAVVPGQQVSGDASATVDRDEATAALTFAWDWDGDGVYEAQGLTSSHTFAAPGRATVTLKVTDTQGLSAVTTRALFVVPPADLVVVTTDADEADPAATPAAPGGSGLSLREALAFAETTPGAQTVLLPPGRVVALSAGVSTGPSRVTLVGFGAALDGSDAGVNPVCLTLTGPAEVQGLEVHHCGAGILDNGTPVTVAWCRLHHNGAGVALAGIDAVLGPGNDVFNNGTGAVLMARGTVVDNTIRAHTAAAVEVRSGGALSHVVGNVLLGNAQGVDLQGQASGVFIWHDTFVGNQTGVRGAVTATALDVRNNIFAGQSGWAIDAPQNAVAIDANDFFQNVTGACRRCITLGPRTLAASPQFVDAALGDYRPLSLSPVIDRGLDLGVDRDGPLPGLFLGAAPDLGAFEVR